MEKAAFRSDVHGLRGFAILAVVFYHLSEQLVPGGFLGVDIFFLISGFVITTKILRDCSHGHFKYFDFVERRIRRLFPALIFTLTLVLAFGWFSLFTEEYRMLANHVFSSSYFWQNYNLAIQDQDYFSVSIYSSPVMHLWSLSIEEQFYFVFPLVVIFCVITDVKLSKILVGLIGVSIFVFIFYHHVGFGDAFYSSEARVWEILLGCLMAVIREKPVSGKKFSVSAKSLLVYFGMSLLVFSIFFFRADYFNDQSYLVLLPLAGVSLILLHGSAEAGGYGFLSSRFFSFYGSISYPLYLIHWPLISFSTVLYGQLLWFDRFLIFTGGTLTSFLVYKFIEKKFLLYGNFKHSVLLTTCLLGLSLVAYVISNSTVDTRQWVNETKIYDMDSKNAFVDMNNGICKKYDLLLDNPRCAYTGEKPTTVILGDSHAPPLFLGLEQLYKSKNRGLAIIGGGGGCPPLYEVISTDHPKKDLRNCVALITDTIDVISEDADLEFVLLVSRGPLYTTGQGFGDIVGDDFGHWALYNEGQVPNNKNNAEVFAVGLEKTISKFISNGKKVVYIFDVPELGFNASKCEVSRKYFPNLREKGCILKYKDYLARTHKFKHMVEGVLARFDVMSIDLSEALCDKERCISHYKGRPLYRDDDHLNEFGAIYVATQLEKQFEMIYNSR